MKKGDQVRLCGTMPCNPTDTYFRTLPTDTVQRILGFIAHRDCEELCLRPEGPLREASRHIFSHLDIFERYESGDDAVLHREMMLEDGQEPWIKFHATENVMSMNVADGDDSISVVMELYGSTLEKVCMYNYVQSYLLFEYCTDNLKHLKISLREAPEFLFFLCDVLHKFGPGLKTLCIEGTIHAEEFDALEVQCINASLKRCVNLTSITMETIFCRGLWAMIGGNLESISLDLRGGEDKEDIGEIFSDIRENCPRLSAFHFYPETDDEDGALYRFLVSYGSQMIRAPIRGIRLEDLAALTTACPNLLVQTISFTEKMKLERLQALGGVLNDVIIGDDQDLSAVSSAVASCKRLVSLDLSLYSLDDEDILPVGKFTFQHRMMELKELHMYNYVTCTEMIELISRNTPNLTALNVTCTDKILEASRFECIVTNVPHLQFVALGDSDIIMYDIDDDERWERRELFGDFVRTFLKWRRLEELELIMGVPLPSTEEFRTICLPLRMRGISCSLNVGKSWMIQDKLGNFNQTMTHSLGSLNG